MAVVEVEVVAAEAVKVVAHLKMVDMDTDKVAAMVKVPVKDTVH